jgi:hypothetical protein
MHPRLDGAFERRHVRPWIGRWNTIAMRARRRCKCCTSAAFITPKQRRGRAERECQLECRPQAAVPHEHQQTQLQADQQLLH